MNDILVSICCCAYNHQDYISDAIESFLMQRTNFNYEIIIGEDCSEDNTRKIVDDYMHRYPDKIRLITSEKNVGAKENSRRIYENAKGKYIALCDGDDYWISAFKLQKQIDYMENNQDCSMCFHAAEIVDVDKNPTGKMVRPYDENKVSTTSDLIIGGGGFFATAAVIFPKKHLEEAPEFYLNSSVGDYPLAIFLSSKGFVYYIDEVMSAYRTGHFGSWTSAVFLGENANQNIINNTQNDIYILDNYNKYSNYKYNTIINKVILEREIKILFLEKKYIKRSFDKFNALGIKGKCKLMARYYLPNLYNKLGNIRKKIMILIIKVN